MLKMDVGSRQVFVGVCFLLLNACSVGRSHTPDSKPEQNFFRQEAEFEALLAEVQADEKLTTIGREKFAMQAAPFPSRMAFHRLNSLD
jgi:outer membrane biogenesis lipoprotein LolB